MIQIGDLQVSIAVIISVVIVIGVVILLFAILGRLFKRYTSKESNVAKEKKTVMRMLHSILRFVIILIAILTILQINGVNITAAIAGLGIAGAVGALAVQDLMKDFIMGINIVTDHYFHVDDVVDYKGYVGKVIALTMRSTKLQSITDNSIKTIENHIINEITVLSRTVLVEVPFAYEIKREKATEVMENIVETASKQEGIDNVVFKGTQTFGESEIRYLLTFCCEPANIPNCKRAVNKVIQDEFAKAGISMPFKQIDIHTK